MKLTYFGHSCFTLDTQSGALMFDPFFSQNPLVPNSTWRDINPDYVLASHGHFDHILDVPFFLSKQKASLIANYEVATWFQKQGFDKVIKMNLGSKISIGDLQIRMTAAYHSSTLPDGSPGGNPGGFLIECEGKRIFFAGDTGLGPYLEFIGKYWPPDLALLPISGRVTMDAQDALFAAQLLNCAHVVGMHFDAFPELTINKAHALNIFENTNTKLTLLEPGQTLSL